MPDTSRKYQEILRENTLLKQRIQEIEKLESDRGQTEADLRESERKYRLIAENTADLIMILDMNMRFTYISPAVMRLRGFTVEEAMRQTIDQVLTPESLGLVQTVFENAMEREAGGLNDSNIIRMLELEHYRKDSSIAWMEVSLSFLRGREGKPEGVLIVSRDVTERKEAEEEMQKMASIVKHSIEVVSLTDPEGNMVFLNETGCRMLGIEPARMTGKSIMDIIPGELQPMFRTQVMSILNKGGSWEGDLQYRNQKTGKLFDVYTMAYAIKNPASGAPRYFASVSLDITERKVMEENYRSIFDNAREGIFRTTPEGRFVLANRAMARILGYDSPEALIDGVTDIPGQLYIHPEERSQTLEFLEREGYVKNAEVQWKRKDGATIWVHRTMRAVRDEKGKILYLEGLVTDITDRKKSVDQLRKALVDTIQAIASIVESRDPYTAGHQRRVADLAAAIAAEMGLSVELIEGLRMAGVIHDIGKVSVPSDILNMPRKLTDIEFSLIKTHAKSGYEMVKDIEFPWPIARMILEHHERINGSGYPNGLTGDRLLLESRILAVADVVEAMATHRPYRAALSLDVAMDEITKNRGVIYDPDAVDACLRLFREKGYKIIQMY
ncbi:MAG TPA: PAS domain S-box protein [Smithellaceae bacterium]|nr:PAS domain S-box protein [Smithellaceae bacterium]